MRWFSWSFLVGVTAPPLFFFGWIWWQQFSTLRQLPGQDSPIVLATNPFIELTDSAGKVIAGDNITFLLAILFCGLGAGVLGLVIGALRRLIRQASR